MRIKKENFLPYLTGQKELRPRPGDLSFANLTKKKSRLCSSENWKVTFSYHFQDTEQDDDGSSWSVHAGDVR